MRSKSPEAASTSTTRSRETNRLVGGRGAGGAALHEDGGAGCDHEGIAVGRRIADALPVASGAIEEKAKPRGAAPDEEDVGVGRVGRGAPASGAVGGLERERAEGDVAGLHGGEKRQRVFGAGVYGALRRGEHPADDGEGERRRAAAREHETAVGAEEIVVARRGSALVGVTGPAGPHRVVVEV